MISRLSIRLWRLDCYWCGTVGAAAAVVDRDRILILIEFVTISRLGLGPIVIMTKSQYPHFISLPVKLELELELKFIQVIAREQGHFVAL